MAEHRAADVRSLDALRQAKDAIVRFRETVGGALAEAHAEAQRTLFWLTHDQTMRWKQEIRRRSEKVNQAKSELERAKLSAMDDRATCIDQRKALDRAQANLKEAEVKSERVRHWARLLDRELMLYRARCQSLARAVEIDLPQGEARLELLADRLEAYVRLAGPAPEIREGGSAPTGVEPPREAPA